MTYIEFLSNEAVENICSCLANQPERVILIGDNKKKLQAHAERYRQFFLDKGEDIDFICTPVIKNRLDCIVDRLCEIVETYEDCVFDLAGGEEMMLVAVGIVFHRYRDMDLQLHRFNLRNGILYDCDRDGNTISVSHDLALSVDDLIRLYGGKVVYEDERHGATYRWDWTEEFQNDIRAMWNICRKYTREWNAQIGVLAAADSQDTMNEGGLTVESELPDLVGYLRERNEKYVINPDILRALSKSRLVRVESQFGTLSLSFKNEQIKHCLTKAGQSLEMLVTLAAMEAKDKDDHPVYNDVCNGVNIDWDGTLHEPGTQADTANEIDVMMMHGLVPVFVSCKNGNVGIDELYKLHTVATRFGGKYAKKVIVVTTLDENPVFKKLFVQRAADMNIRVIDNICLMNAAELEKTIASLWCG